ncbi:MAG: hypothetical protein ACI4WG_03810 [Erysipelotrichaceae bacterium]
MDIFDKLCDNLSLQGNSTICDKSNYSENDNILKHQQLFDFIFTKYPESKVIENYPLQFDVNHLPNKRIGYRDISKVNQNNCAIPFLLFLPTKDDYAIILLSNNDYIEARGMQFCITQKGSTLADYSGIILACDVDCFELKEVINAIYNDKNSIAAQQHYLDNRYITDPETMKDKCVNLAKEIISKVQTQLLNISQQDRQPLIDNTIMEIFLLKKALYVKYMANQKILLDRHSGNAKEQRVFAKSYIDDIPFISYYTLWNLKQ